MLELCKNLPFSIGLLKVIIFPLGARFNLPPDKLEMKIANLVSHDTDVRRLLINGIYLSPNANNPTGRLNDLLKMADEIEPLIDKMRRGVRNAEHLSDVSGSELIEVAASHDIINNEEKERLQEFDRNIMEIINVDDFDYDDFSRPHVS